MKQDRGKGKEQNRVFRIINSQKYPFGDSIKTLYGHPCPNFFGLDRTEGAPYTECTQFRYCM